MWLYIKNDEYRVNNPYAPVHIIKGVKKGPENDNSE